MPRRDLTQQRTEEILDAFERCVARFGLAGSSLEQVAREAGVKRSILRHYIGNREDLELAMARRFVTRFRSNLDDLTRYIESGSRVDRILDALFGGPTNWQDVLLVEALIAKAETSEDIRQLVVAVVEETIETIRNQLRAAFPKADARSAWNVAYGVVGIWFNHDSLLPLSLPRRHGTAARDSARRLIETLA